ncbi:MAG TPA: hypothetical protein VHD35_10030 [Chitinophagaceae bacterium]|nr:hypothetical protein [Chitinophagaceae bacterium]
MQKYLILKIAIVCCAVFTAYSAIKIQTAKEVVPNVFVNAASNNFQTHQGITFLDNKPFSGWQYQLFDNGDTAYLFPFINGKENGVATQWYPGKKLKEVRQYEKGNKTGEHRGWWENGRLRFDYHFSNDLYEGSVEEWYETGQLFRKMNYEKGYEKGLQKIWRPDGSLHANYEVKNGRYYGLTGVFHCKNVWKDEK